jgi:hypothetical protein
MTKHKVKQSKSKVNNSGQDATTTFNQDVADKAFNDMKGSLSSIGLPISNVQKLEDLWLFESEVKRGRSAIKLLTMFDPRQENVVVYALLPHLIPPDKRLILCEPLNLINGLGDINKFSLNMENGQVGVCNGQFLVKNTFNKVHFQRILKRLIGSAQLYFPLIWNQVICDQSPTEIASSLLREIKSTIK